MLLIVYCYMYVIDQTGALFNCEHISLQEPPVSNACLEAKPPPFLPQPLKAWPLCLAWLS